MRAEQERGPGLALDKRSVSVFVPVYGDERTVERVTLKALDVLSRLAPGYEVIIVDDGTPCRAGQNCQSRFISEGSGADGMSML